MPKSTNTPPRSGTLTRILLLAVLAALGGFVYSRYGNLLQLDYLASREAELREFQASNPRLVYGVAFLVYAGATGLSIPGAFVLSLVYGWYFGLLPGVLLVSFASTTGATVAFLLSRFLLRDFIHRRFGDRLENFNSSLEREGPFFLFTLRLIPAVPFFVINAVMGLTPIATRTFWWVSQLGMLPGTFVYLYAGSRVPSLDALAEKGVNAVLSAHQLTQLGVAFGILGLFPFVVRGLVSAARRRRQCRDSPNSSDK